MSGELMLLIFLANKVVLAVGRKHHLLPGMGSALLCNFLPFIGVVRTFLSSPLLNTFYPVFVFAASRQPEVRENRNTFDKNKRAASLLMSGNAIHSNSQFVNYISWQKFGSFDQG